MGISGGCSSGASTSVTLLHSVHGVRHQCVLELFEGCLLLHLGVLQTRNQLLFFEFHASYILFVLKALVLLARQLFVHLLFGLFLFLLLALDLLGLGLHLLLLDHVLNHVGLGDVLVILVVKQLLGLVLFLLRITDLLPHPFLVRHLVVHDLLPLFFFLGVVHHGFLGFLVHALLQSELLLLLGLHISAPLLDDFASLLPGLVNFLKSSNFFVL